MSETKSSDPSLPLPTEEETIPSRPNLGIHTKKLSPTELQAYVADRRRSKATKPSEPIRKGILRLELVESRQSITLPIKQRILLGRPDPITGTQPDVDFTPLAGYRMGVSRRHAEIFWHQTNLLNLYDLGSSNGTYLNGVRLTSNKMTPIYNGDEVHLGQLAIYVYYEIQDKEMVIPFRAEDEG